MDPNVISIIAVIGTLSAVMLGWWGKSRTVRQDTANDAAKDATLQADMAYLKRGIDDMRIEIKMQGQRHDALSEMTIRMDESIKSAHKRLDKLEAK
ncbi:hypothetical protein B1748_29205 [Paenibacillus sp. MY03]|nr:hypothetical protein B1748_29205 [Paenibacillus sp. MY03]